MRRTPRTLIANEGYEIGWTHFDGAFFNQPLPPVVVHTSAGPISIPQDSPANQQDPTLDFEWGSQGYTIPLNVNSSGQILQVDNYRNLLVVQNNSVATSPDVAPTLFIALDGPVQTVIVSNPAPNTFAYNAFLALSPGEGAILDVRVPRNALYSVWGSFVNTGNTVFVNGSVSYGRTTNAPPKPVQGLGNVSTWAQGPQIAPLRDRR